MSEEKSEQPSQKSLNKIRKQGKSAKSFELISASTLAAGFCGLLFLGKYLYQSIVKVLNNSWNDLYTLGNIKERFVTPWFPILLFFLCGLLLFIVGMHLLQTGWVWSRKKSPSGNTTFSSLFYIFCFSLLKMAGIGLIVYFFVSTHQASLSGKIFSPPDQKGEWILFQIYLLCFSIIAYLLFLSVGDFFYQKWLFQKKSKMTKSEKKEEQHDLEGNPLIRSMRRRRRK